MTKEEALKKHLGETTSCYDTYSDKEIGWFKAAMDEYAKQEKQEANEFISGIAKLLGEDSLGWDDLQWSIDDFKTAIEEKAKQVAIGFKEWNDSNLEDKKWEQYDGHDRWINPHTREVVTTEQLFEIYIKSKQ